MDAVLDSTGALPQLLENQVDRFFGHSTGGCGAHSDKGHKAFHIVFPCVVYEERPFSETQVSDLLAVFTEQGQSGIDHRDVPESDCKGGIRLVHLVDAALKLLFRYRDSIGSRFVDFVPYTDKRIIPPGNDKNVATLSAQNGIRILGPELNGQRMTGCETTPDHKTEIPRKAGFGPQIDDGSFRQQAIGPGAGGVEDHLPADFKPIARKKIPHHDTSNAVRFTDEADGLAVVADARSRRRRGAQKRQSEPGWVVELGIEKNTGTRQPLPSEMGIQLQASIPGDDAPAWNTTCVVDDPPVSIRGDEIVNQQPRPQDFLALHSIAIGRHEDRNRSNEMRRRCAKERCVPGMIRERAEYPRAGGSGCLREPSSDGSRTWHNKNHRAPRVRRKVHVMPLPRPRRIRKLPPPERSRHILHWPTRTDFAS